MWSHLPSPVGVLTIFNRDYIMNKERLLQMSAWKPVLSKWLLLSWPRLLERSGMDTYTHLCYSFVHLFSAWMKMLAQSASRNCFQHSSNKLFVQPFFVNFHLWQQLSMNCVNLSAFEKNYSSVWCICAYICFHFIKWFSCWCQFE